MKKGLIEVVFILDMSGSMGSLATDTIGGFNAMIEDQKKDPGETYVTTVLFNHHYDVIHNHILVEEVPQMTKNEYFPFGATALLDAVGYTIDNVGERLADTPEDERPEKVIFVITTDGYENSSSDYTKTKVKEMIEHQQSKYSWVFMFLGANMDAVNEASSLGISASYSKTYTASSAGTNSVYNAVSRGLSSVKACDDITLTASVVADCLNNVQ